MITQESPQVQSFFKDSLKNPEKVVPFPAKRPESYFTIDTVRTVTIEVPVTIHVGAKVVDNGLPSSVDPGGICLEDHHVAHIAFREQDWSSKELDEAKAGNQILSMVRLAIEENIVDGQDEEVNSALVEQYRDSKSSRWGGGL